MINATTAIRRPRTAVTRTHLLSLNMMTGFTDGKNKAYLLKRKSMWLAYYTIKLQRDADKV